MSFGLLFGLAFLGALFDGNRAGEKSDSGYPKNKTYTPRSSSPRFDEEEHFIDDDGYEHTLDYYDYCDECDDYHDE